MQEQRGPCAAVFVAHLDLVVGAQLQVGDAVGVVIGLGRHQRQEFVEAPKLHAGHGTAQPYHRRCTAEILMMTTGRSKRKVKSRRPGNSRTWPLSAAPAHLPRIEDVRTSCGLSEPAGEFNIRAQENPEREDSE